MIKVDRDTEFKLVRNSFKVIKKINLQEIGFNQISGTNLYKYQSDEYKILNYSIKPKVIFLIDIKENNIFIKLQDISIKNLPNIFKTLNLNIEVKILAKSNFYIIIRHISLRYEDNNKLIKYLSENFKNKFLNNLIDIISRRFDRKLVKKVLKEI